MTRDDIVNYVLNNDALLQVVRRLVECMRLRATRELLKGQLWADLLELKLADAMPPRSVVQTHYMILTPTGLAKEIVQLGEIERELQRDVQKRYHLSIVKGRTSSAIKFTFDSRAFGCCFERVEKSFMALSKQHVITRRKYRG